MRWNSVNARPSCFNKELPSNVAKHGLRCLYDKIILSLITSKQWVWVSACKVYKSYISSQPMHKGSEDNLRASPVRAVQAMMASRLKNVLPPMTVKRERLSWYKAIPLSSDPQFEACLIDCDSQTGILWYRTSKERLCGWKVAIWPRRNTISHRFKSEGYLIITVSTRKIPYKLIVSHCHETLIVSTESLAFRIAFRDGDKRRYYFTCLLLNSSFLPMSRNIINFSFFYLFFFIYTRKKT